MFGDNFPKNRQSTFTEYKMAKNKKPGLIDRLALGKEKSEGYARASLPSNRWELFWDIFKGRFWKIVIINLLMLLFFIPLFVLIYIRSSGITSLGTMYPFAQPFGVGYQAPPSLVGVSEQIVLDTNIFIYLFMPVVALIAAVGVAGGAYVIRNMVWTEGIFVANDFWRGIKKNFKSIALIAVSFSVIFYMSVVGISLCNKLLVLGTNIGWLFNICKVIAYFVLIFYAVMCMHMITMAVTYDLKFRHLIKNSFLLTVGLLPHTIFFLTLGCLPIILTLLGGILTIIGIVALFLMGISLLLLVWTDFCQWSYDKFLNDRIEGAQKNRGIYEKVKSSDSGAIKKYKEQLASLGKSALSSKPIKPITDEDLTIAELPTSFNRGDIIKLNESKQALYDDHAKYVEEHKNDPQYQQMEEETKAWKKDRDDRQKRIDQAKRELAKRNRNK